MPTKNELRRARAEARDVPRADRTAEDWDRIDEIWKKAEGEYFTDAIRSKADYITPEDGVFNLQELLRAIEVQRA